MKAFLWIMSLGIALQLAPSASAADFKKWSVYPFSLEVPRSLQPFSEHERELFRSNFASASAEYYRRYYQFNDSPLSAVPYMAAFRTPSFDITFVALVMRVQPQTDYLASISKDMGEKMEWGKRQGVIKDARIFPTTRIGHHDSITIEAEKPDGSHDFTAMLYDDELPYNVIQLTLSSSGGDAKEARRAFDHILKTIKIDFTLRGSVGRQPFVISKRCQEYFVVTEISNPEARNIVFVIQESHWDWRAQWNLHQGLRVFFHENSSLLAKSAFLSEGANAMERVSVAPLTELEPLPEPALVKAILESFLVTGYLTFNWMTSSEIPVFGTEDWPLYRDSARLWVIGKTAPWAVTVAVRNQKMVEVLSRLQGRYDNPMLFAGGMHLHAIDRDMFQEGQAALDFGSPASGKPNQGIKDLLSQRGINYIYIEPRPDLSLRDDASAMTRYRDLLSAQLDGSYDAYEEKFATDYQSRLASGAYDDGVTVRPNPAEAAKVVAILQKKSGGDGDDSDNSDDTGGKNRGSDSGRKAIDRFKDALSKVNLRGKNLRSGRKAINDADPTLTEARDEKTGLHQWSDKNRVRVEYRRKGAHNDAHWAKWAQDGTRIDNAGRPGVEHIPAK